jgi:hypothetical protein
MKSKEARFRLFGVELQVTLFAPEERKYMQIGGKFLRVGARG